MQFQANHPQPLNRSNQKGCEKFDLTSLVCLVGNRVQFFPREIDSLTLESKRKISILIGIDGIRHLHL